MTDYEKQLRNHLDLLWLEERLTSNKINAIRQDIDIHKKEIEILEERNRWTHKQIKETSEAIDEEEDNERN